MSRLSKLFHREKSEIFQSTIVYLETVDLPGSTKASIAASVMKAIHVGEGNEWSDEIEKGVISGIDYVLGSIRGWAQKQDHGVPQPPPPQPPVTSIYDVWTPGTLPADGTLLDMGFTDGKLKWVTHDKSAWLVSQQGDLLAGPDGQSADYAGTIGSPA